jgi:hypothetical protein
MAFGRPMAAGYEGERETRRGQRLDLHHPAIYPLGAPEGTIGAEMLVVFRSSRSPRRLPHIVYQSRIVYAAYRARTRPANSRAAREACLLRKERSITYSTTASPTDTGFGATSIRPIRWVHKAKTPKCAAGITPPAHIPARLRLYAGPISRVLSISRFTFVVLKDLLPFR